MWKRVTFTSLFSVLTLAVAACSSAPALEMCPGLPAPEGEVVTTTLPLALYAGEETLELGKTVTAESGARYRVEKLKMYVSEVALHQEGGGHEHALLVDSKGEALPHGVQLIDAEAGALSLSLRAPRGVYTGLSMTIGVPAMCPDGETALNHADASAMPAPLDVDSDMYWSWDPGYVFFKIEGRVDDDGEKAFFYHVGEDDRLAHITLGGAIDVREGSSATILGVDVNRLFVTPSGQASPRLDGEDDDRKSHSGPLSDQVKENLEGSAVFELL